MNVKYSVLFGLYNFGLGLGLLNLASASRLWPRPWPQGSGLGLKCLALASSIWPRLTSLVTWPYTALYGCICQLCSHLFLPNDRVFLARQVLHLYADIVCVHSG